MGTEGGIVHQRDRVWDTANENEKSRSVDMCMANVKRSRSNNPCLFHLVYLTPNSASPSENRREERQDENTKEKLAGSGRCITGGHLLLSNNRKKRERTQKKINSTSNN